MNKTQHISQINIKSDRKTFEAILGQCLPEIAVIFAFPGLGIGEIHDCLRGCTLETQLFDDAAKIFSPLGVAFLGVTSGKAPPETVQISYSYLSDPVAPFSKIEIGKEVFFERVSFVISGSDVHSFCVTNSIEQHVTDIKKFIASEVVQKIIKFDTGILDIDKALVNACSLAKGADSHAILSLPSNPPTVLKIGSSKVLEPEIALIKAVSGQDKKLFPKLYSHGKINQNHWMLMHAANPASIVDTIFENIQNAQLRRDWIQQVASIFAPMSALYAKTLIKHKCKTSAYHYTGRIKHILRRPDTLKTALKAAHINLNSISDKPLVINGHFLPSFTDLEMRNALAMAKMPACHITLVHGDLHLSNVLKQYDGVDFVFIDPRVVWDENPIDVFGYADPLYDLATMLHSVGAMAVILARILNGSCDTLSDVKVNENQITINVDDTLFSTLQTAFNGFINIAPNIIPETCLNTNWQRRLLVGAAGAFMGWLKYPEAVQSQEVWWTIFSAASLCLAEAEKWPSA